jgi:hypothetical protein
MNNVGSRYSDGFKYLVYETHFVAKLAKSQGGFTQVQQAGELSEGAQNDWAQLPKGLHTHLRQPESTQAWWDEKKSYVASHG